VAVPVVNIRHVGVLVRQRLMPVLVRMRLAGRIVRRVRVLMVLVVDVQMFVRQLRVN
jgi:hypothetical protein